MLNFDDEIKWIEECRAKAEATGLPVVTAVQRKPSKVKPHHRIMWALLFFALTWKLSGYLFYTDEKGVIHNRLYELVHQ